MVRQMSGDKEREYAELSAFVDMYATYFLKIDASDPKHPTNVGERIVAAVGKSKALAGLRQAVNDCLEGLQDLSPEMVGRLDSALREAGIVTVSELRRRQSRHYKAIMRRGAIRNETEFHLIKSVLEGCSESLASDERENLGAMLLEFENAAAHSVGAEKGSTPS